MTRSLQEEFIKKVIKVIDRWSFEQCALCDDGTMVSIEGMLDFRCSKCGETMNPINYLGAVAKIVYNYREQLENHKESVED
jgi:tRNA(Ile2) C34 agmatinyltransferase TiaS